MLSSGVLAIDGTLETASDAFQVARGLGTAPLLRPSRYGSNPLVTGAAALVLGRTLLDPAEASW